MISKFIPYVIPTVRYRLASSDFSNERARLVCSDFVISFMWVWSGALTRLLVYRVLGLGYHPTGEILKAALYVCSIFLFAHMGKVTKGGSCNTLTVLARSISHDFEGLSFTIFARIPTQVLGSIVGVTFITLTLPQETYGASLKAGIHEGALTEGLLAFGIVSVSLGLKKYDPDNSLMRTWIYSVSRLALQTLGSDLTGGIMNPAAACGWAFVLGNHSAKEHLFVYWVAPIAATLVAAWALGFLSWPHKQNKTPQFIVSVPVPRRLDASSRILSRKTTKFE